MRLSIILFCIISFGALAQNRIKGKVADSANVPLPYITVALLNAKDSSIVRGINTNEQGEFEFKNSKSGEYLVTAEAIGFSKHYSQPIFIDSIAEIELQPISLTTGGVNLNEVSVIVQKKPIEFKGGNIIVNVDGSPMAVGNSVYDLLSRLPGVTVDNDVISINGNSGVKILIDDRNQQLAGAQLINLLKSLPASTIDKIEVLKVPPVKYDAAGGAGIINIKTKKVKITGFSGSVYANASQGFYTNYGSGFSLNYKGKKVSFFSGFNIQQSTRRLDMIFERHVTNDSVTTHLYQNNYNKTFEQYYSYYFGSDWFINKNNILGFKFESNPGLSETNRRGEIKLVNNDIGYDELPYYSDTHNDWDDYNANLNYEHTFDTVGTTLKFVTDYTYNRGLYAGKNDNRFKNNYGNEVLPYFIFTNTNNSGLSLIASRLDFEKKLGKSVYMETGVKYSYNDMYSDFVLKQKDYTTGIYEVDSIYTNKFLYNEQIQAAYLNLRKELKKFNFSFGVRAENTEVNARSVTAGTIIKRNYLGFFPVVSIDYNRSESHAFSLSYNRRLERPNYNSFNPYRAFYSNILVSGRGNPYLVPQYNNSFNLSHTFKGSLTNSFNYSYVENSIIGYSSQNDSTKQIVWETGNLKTVHNFAYNIHLYYEIKKWWTITFHTGCFVFMYDGKLNNKDYKVNSMSYGVWLHNQFLLPNDFKLEISGFCIGPWLGGIYYTQPRGALNIGLKKSFFKNKLDAYISGNDILYTLSVYNKVNYQNQNFFTKDKPDTQRLNFGLTYNFGKLKIRQRDNQSAAEEERNRIKR